MKVDVVETHDIHNFYLRWEILYQRNEKVACAALGGPLALEIETSSFVDPSGNKQPTAKVKVALWPFVGPRNFGQGRWTDVDARRRFWVNLLETVGTTVVETLFAVKPGSVPKDGLVLPIPEKPPVLA